MPTNVRDPRTVVTPDAFELDPALLGLPLAGPWRRFWAFMVDLVVIGVLTAVTSGVSLFVLGAVGFVLLLVAFKPGDAPRVGAAGAILRGLTGCLGLIVLAVVLLLAMVTRSPDGLDRASSAGAQVGEALERAGVESGDLGVGELVGDVAGGVGGVLTAQRMLAGAETGEEAEEAALLALAAADRVAGAGGGASPGVDGGGDGRPLDRDARLRLLLDMAPDDAPWSGRARPIMERAVDRYERAREGSDGGPETDGGGAGTEDPAAEVAAMSDREALAAWAGVLEVGAPEEGPDAERARLLRRRVAALAAADTLAALEEDLADAIADREEAREALRTEREEGGFVALLADIWDQAGSAIGLWSVYFTVALALFGGRTVGKRLFGLRVLRLDGEPLGWWASFERAGGYVAGVATGLLGFAQVFWDPNRQCVHDKIGGTVVVIDGAEATPGAWQEAWGDAGGAAGGQP